MPKKNIHSDRILLIIAAVLIILGIVILTSISAYFSQENYGNPYYFLRHQLFLGLIPGLILFFLVSRIPLKSLKKWALLTLLINLVFSIMVFLPQIGISSGGATRWLSLGGKITFQPSEFLKLTFILYLAAWLASRTPQKKPAKEREERVGKNFSRLNLTEQNSGGFGQTFFAFLVMTGLVASLLIFQPDISTLGIIIVASLLMYFLAGTPLWHNISIILIGIGAFYYLINIAHYRMRRWTVFLNPEIDPLGMGYQLKQALIAVGSGGIFGLGLGLSRQKFGFLPYSMSDSVFAIFSEETGFLGAAILISLFLLLLCRGFKIAKESNDKFSQLAAVGITCWLVLQAFINIGSMIGIFPLAGIPIPFISYGGTHLVAELIGLGILANISRKI